MSKDKKKKRDKWTLKMQTKTSTASIGTPWQIQQLAHPTATLEFTHNGTRYRGTVYPVENAE